MEKILSDSQHLFFSLHFLFVQCDNPSLTVNVLEEDDDSLMIKWFELVSEKNDLVRQEADLVYM